MHYRTIRLKSIIEEFGKKSAKETLSKFLCPLNPDVQEFVREKAIPFEKAGMARTNLVVAEDDSGSYGICAIYALTTKSIEVERGLPQELRKKAFGTSYAIGSPVTAILIGQLSKNYYNGNDRLITGDQLMSLIIEEVKLIDTYVPSVCVWLECEDNESLKSYYERFGFIYFSDSEDGLLQYLMPTKLFINPKSKP